MMAVGGQDEAVDRAVSSIQDASRHITQLLFSAEAVRECGLITIGQSPRLTSKINVTQRKIRSDVDKLSAELPNDMRTCVMRIQTCGEEYLRFNETYSSRYEGGWITAFFRWLSFNRDTQEMHQYLQFLAQNVQKVVDPLDCLNNKLADVSEEFQEDLAQLDRRKNEYHRLMQISKEQELIDAMNDVNSRYLHALLGFGGSVIGTIAVGGLALYALKSIGADGTRALLGSAGSGLAVAGMNEVSQAHPYTVNNLVKEGILGNWKKLNKARDEWYELKKELVELRGGEEMFLHAGLQQLSKLVDDLRGHLVRVIADWKFVRDQMQTAADEIKDAKGQQQVAVILRNIKAAAGHYEEAMRWAEACIPRPNP